MLRILKILAILALVVAGLVWPAAWGIDQTRVTVQQIQGIEGAAPGRIDEVRALTAAEDDDPAELYGVPIGAPIEIVLAGDAVVAAEKHPELKLYYVGENSGKPLQARTIWFLARMIALASLAAAIGLLVLRAVLARRADRKAGNREA